MEMSENPEDPSPNGQIETPANDVAHVEAKKRTIYSVTEFQYR